MPIGAAVGTAVVGGGAAILGSKAQKKAAGKAADASEAGTQAQLQLGRESLALNKDIYNANFGLLSPYVSRGDVAGGQINALLGLPNAPAMTSPIAPGGSGSTANDPAKDAWAQGVLENLMPTIGPKRTTTALGISDPSDRLDYLSGVLHDGTERQTYNSYVSAHPYTPPAPTTPAPGTPATPAAGGQNTAHNAQNAFNQFANSAGMQFQLDTAHDAINNGYAAKGELQSGAAMKAISDRSQDIALNNYFLPYMSLLGGQQNVGAQSGAAIAGVGSNFGNTAAGINNGMGAAIGNNAANLGNLALANGQNNANMWAGLGSSFGQAIGAFGKPK